MTLPTTAAAARPRTRRLPRAETRRRVIEGAFAAFVERGFMGASIDFICSKAGLSRGAFYSNFANKYELFAALYERQTDRIRAWLAASADTLHRNRDVLGQLPHVLAPPDDDEFAWDIINKEFVIHALRDEEARRTLAALRASLRSDLRAILRTMLLAMGRIPPDDLDEIARLVVAIHEGDLTQRGLERETRGGSSLTARFLPDILRAASHVDPPPDS